MEEERKNLKVLLDEHRRELESKDVLLQGLEEERSKSVYVSSYYTVLILLCM